MTCKISNHRGGVSWSTNGDLNRIYRIFAPYSAKLLEKSTSKIGLDPEFVESKADLSMGLVKRFKQVDKSGLRV